MADSSDLHLRISGCGHNVDIEIGKDATLGELKTFVEAATGLPSAYQRLVARGCKLEDDAAGVAAAGIADRTKLMLMHSAEYAADAQAFEALGAVSKEITELEKSADLSASTRDELVTQLCCKLDAVDVGGSSTLRELRRAQLRRAHEISVAGAGNAGKL